MDKDDYVRWKQSYIYDTTIPLTKNYMKTPELQKDIATQYKLEQSGEIDKIIHLKLRHTQSQIPRMHGNPKIHKPALSNTEIVDSAQ